VFGDKIYEEDSVICAAAMHAGVIEKDGGEFKMKLVDAVKIYKGVDVNDVKSQSKNNPNAEFSL